MERSASLHYHKCAKSIFFFLEVTHGEGPSMQPKRAITGSNKKNIGWFLTLQNAGKTFVNFTWVLMVQPLRTWLDTHFCPRHFTWSPIPFNVLRIMKAFLSSYFLWVFSFWILSFWNLSSQFMFFMNNKCAFEFHRTRWKVIIKPTVEPPVQCLLTLALKRSNL